MKITAVYSLCGAFCSGVFVFAGIFPDRIVRHAGLFLNISFVVVTIAILYKLLMRNLRVSRLAEEARVEIESHIASLEASRADRQELLENFSIITGGIPSLIAHMDVNQRYLYVNSRYVAWAGRPEAEIIGRTAQEILGDAVYGTTVGCIDQVLQGKFSCMERIAGLAGESRVQYLSFIPRFDEQGKVISYFALINDITEIRQAEEQLRQAHKMEAIGTLAGGIAHDFNNLLTIIMGCAEMIHNCQDNHHKMATLITDAANRGAGLTRSLLSFSRNQEIEVKAINLNSRLKTLESFLCRIIGEDIAFELCLCDGSPCVMADAEQFDQVVMNMVSNARDAMPEGGVLKIATYFYQQSQPLPGGNDDFSSVPCVVVEISDTGSGMSSHTLERIFDPFYTTKEFGKGTGLGLSMAYGIIKKHNGIIKVESTPGEGSMFRIILPGIDLTAEAVRKDLVPGLLQGSETILLVEDDPTVRQILGTMLAKYGYHVLVAPNGEEGLAAFRNFHDPIHLIISDVVMPEKNGPEMYRDIHAINPEIPVIFISGYDSGVVESHGASKQGIHFISKPLNLSHLLAKIRQTLQLSVPMVTAIQMEHDSAGRVEDRLM